MFRKLLIFPFILIKSAAGIFKSNQNFYNFVLASWYEQTPYL